MNSFLVQQRSLNQAQEKKNSACVVFLSARPSCGVELKMNFNKQQKCKVLTVGGGFEAALPKLVHAEMLYGYVFKPVCLYVGWERGKKSEDA